MEAPRQFSDSLGVLLFASLCDMGRFWAGKGVIKSKRDINYRLIKRGSFIQCLKNMVNERRKRL
jgi:hypothetical protein